MMERKKSVGRNKSIMEVLTLLIWAPKLNHISLGPRKIYGGNLSVRILVDRLNFGLCNLTLNCRDICSWQ